MKFGVGQISSVDKTGLEEVKTLLVPYMKGFCESHNVDMVCVMLTNIIDESSELIYEGEEAAELLGKAFHVPAENGAIYLPGVVSRKKQLIPSVMAALQG